ncbi:hypothetical protein EBR56_04255, partial [bacterium]|nr:hypothetical protein [bacterium]
MSADRQQTAARTPRPMHDSGPSDPSDETPGRLRDAIENSRLEVAKLGVRIAGVEERIESGRSAAQSLWWLAGAAVLLGFLTVSLTWQVSRRAAGESRVTRDEDLEQWRHAPTAAPLAEIPDARDRARAGFESGGSHNLFGVAAPAADMQPSSFTEKVRSLAL